MPKITTPLKEMNSSRPLKVYLCDLTHDTIVLVSDTIPLNIGYIAAYAKKHLGENLELQLFKYPDSAIQAIKASPPDVIGLSNYSWNSNLSEAVAQVAKSSNPRVITVQGGTNFPHTKEEQLKFLLARPATDIHTVLEGESGFLNILLRAQECRRDYTHILSKPINGSVFIVPHTRSTSSPELIIGEMNPRQKNLDDIPSPYLSGFLDLFFDGRLTPFLETNRGCPFKCSFCHTGADYFNKVNTFSTERVRSEIAYIAPRVAQHGIANLHLADTNFGMYPRDRIICEALLDAQKEFGWPKQIMATTGKNSKQRVIDITGILGNIFSVNMSVQSMNHNVLSNIQRSNIKLDDYININQHLREQGRSTKAELIIGLPGETRESFVQGVDQVIESGASSTTIYTLMLLHGTKFKDPQYRNDYGIRGKYRVVPLNYGEYDGQRVFDYEEVGVENHAMSYEDYLYLRGYALLVEVLLNGGPFEELFRYGEQMGIGKAWLIKEISDNMKNAPPELNQVMQDFMRETNDELWESEEELLAYYAVEENYKKLLRGEVGGNLIFKYKAISLAMRHQSWISWLEEVLISAGVARGYKVDGKNWRLEIAALAHFCAEKLNGIMDVGANTDPREAYFNYDILAWRKAGADHSLSDYFRSKTLRYIFQYTDAQLETRKDHFSRYGTDINALSKIVTRVSNFEGLFRKVRHIDSPALQGDDPDEDRFTRYALSN